MSLWRKRNVQHNGQNQPKWFNMTALANNDLSIKSEKAMREVQRLGQEIEQDVNQSLTTEQDELIKCGCWFTDTGELVKDDIDLNAFAKLVAEKEREACAKLLERTDLGGLKSDVWLQNYTATILDGYAKAIRARGQT